MVFLLYAPCAEAVCPILQMITNLMKNTELLLVALETSLNTLLTPSFLYATIGVLGLGVLGVFVYP